MCVCVCVCVRVCVCVWGGGGGRDKPGARPHIWEGVQMVTNKKEKRKRVFTSRLKDQTNNDGGGGATGISGNVPIVPTRRRH